MLMKLHSTYNPDAHHFFVSATERDVEETQRIEQRQRRMPERLENGSLRNLGRACTICVPAHSVYDDEQGRMLGYRGDDTVLVFFARPEE
jgi:hypothetical protein